MDELTKLNDAVDIFAEKMKHRLAIKLKMGWVGWDDKRYQKVLRTKLMKNATKLILGETHESVDVANLAMMLYFLGGK